MALKLDASGAVVEVLADRAGIVAPGRRAFLELIDPSSRSKAASFLRTAEVEGIAVDWELTIQKSDSLEVYSFSARRVENDQIIVIAGRNSSAIQAMIDDLQQVSNQHADLLRSTMLELADAQRDQPIQVEDFVALNSALAVLQREVAAKAARLERLNEQKDELLGMVAHDLRNPLGAIAGFAQLVVAINADSLDEQSLMLLDRIGAASRHMLRMVEDLVDLSAIESGSVRLERSVVDVGEVLGDSVALARVAARDKRISIDLQVPEGLVMDVDARKIAQVIDNLLGNAIKFSYSETTVTLRCEQKPDEIVIVVEDQGQGIPEEELDLLFRPFGTTTVRSTGGEKSTGLGLAIAKRIVEAHGGSIEVTSTVDVGSAFVVTLPRADVTV